MRAVIRSSPKQAFRGHRAHSIRMTMAFVVVVAMVLASCASEGPERRQERSPAAIRSDIVRLLPPQVADPQGWATDIQTAFSSLALAPTSANLCAAVAIIEQESSFQADPPVAGLDTIARREIFKRASDKGIPAFALNVALQLSSSDGRTYDERLRAVRTERELSLIYEDFIAQVPLGERLFARLNPVRTGGPMQVGLDFANEHARARPYPYPTDGSLRHEIFTRRGGLYFGIAHLLDYEAPYDDAMIYRFADFNAGRYASRNAAFQQALSIASGRRLDLDGDLVAYGKAADEPGQTEAAARSIATKVDMNDREIRRELLRSDSAGFERSRLFEQVFDLAERRAGKSLPRASVPSIRLQSPKIRRKLTTAWFAERVDARHARCLERARATPETRPASKTPSIAKPPPTPRPLSTPRSTTR